MSEFMLDELEFDALTELINIGVSRAAVALATMVGDQVLLTVPAVTLVSRQNAARLIAEASSEHLVAVRQAFQGEVSGRAFLIFPEANSLQLVRAVAGDHLTLEDILELEHEALAEIGNVILNACVATVANLLQRTLIMSLPEIVRGLAEDFFGIAAAQSEDVVLFVHINFSLKGREVSGYVAMVMDFPSLEALKNLIGQFIRRTIT